MTAFHQAADPLGKYSGARARHQVNLMFSETSVLRRADPVVGPADTTENVANCPPRKVCAKLSGSPDFSAEPGPKGGCNSLLLPGSFSAVPLPLIQRIGVPIPAVMAP